MVGRHRREVLFRNLLCFDGQEFKSANEVSTQFLCCALPNTQNCFPGENIFEITKDSLVWSKDRPQTTNIQQICPVILRKWWFLLLLCKSNSGKLFPFQPTSICLHMYVCTISSQGLSQQWFLFIKGRVNELESGLTQVFKFSFITKSTPQLSLMSNSHINLLGFVSLLQVAKSQSWKLRLKNMLFLSKITGK